MEKRDGKVAAITDVRLEIGLAPAKPFVAEGGVVFITTRWHDVFYTLISVHVLRKPS